MNKFVSLFYSILIIAPVFAQKNNDLSFDLPIYKTDTVVWFGPDFSLIRLSNEKKMGDEEKITPLLEVWIEGYSSAISNVKLASLLGVKKVINDKDYTSELYKTELPKEWIVNRRHIITEDDISDHIENFKSDNEGIGVVYIVENFFKGLSGVGDEVPSVVHGYFVWFDIRSKDVIAIQTIDGTPATAYYNGAWVVGTRKGSPKDKGMVGYWLQGMIDATIAFTIDYKNAIPKEVEQY
jgi:hypothetical protein